MIKQAKWAALSAVILFATGGLCIKVIPTSAFTIAGTRSIVAVVFFMAYLGMRGDLKQAFRLTALGWATAVTYALVVSFFVMATKLTTAANAIFLQYTMPAWVLIGGSIWLKERITAGRMTSVICCLIGMFLFFQGELKPSDWLGNTLALASGLCFAIVTLLFRFDRKGLPIASVMMGNVLTAVSNLPLAFYFYPSDFTVFPGFGSILTLLWLGIFQIGLAYICYTKALKGLPAIEVAILALLEPILNPVLVFFSIGEVPSLWAILGGSVIMISVLVRILFVEEIEETPVRD